MPALGRMPAPSRLDAVRQNFLARAPLMEQHIALDHKSGKGWTIWTLFPDQPYTEEAVSILDYDGIQIAYVPLTEFAQQHLQSAACWLEQWRRAITLAFNKGEQEGLWLTSALLRLFVRTCGSLPGLHIETGPRVG